MEKQFPEFSAVLFDMDGVIFDTEKVVVACWQEVAKKYGIPHIEDTCRKCLGLNQEATVRIFLDTYGEDFPYAAYKQEMRELLQTDDRFARLDRDAAMVIRTMTNTKFKIDDHSEVVNMCEAIQGLIDDGVVKGIQSEKRETALRLSKMGLSIKQIAQATELSEDDVLKLIQK